MMFMGEKAKLITWASLTGGVFVWSALNPHDMITWWLEVTPVLVGAALLTLTYRNFPLTQLVYGLITVHAMILMVGGHYTYAHVPLFDWLKNSLGWTRNNYDKVGHFAQGFVPAIIARELLLRKTRLIPGKMLFFLVVCVCLAVSACYELLEWLAAVALGSGADEFLGSQGDVWDTQKDMAWALAGAIAAQLILAKAHDRQLQKLSTNLNNQTEPNDARSKIIQN